MPTSIARCAPPMHSRATTMQSVRAVTVAAFIATLSGAAAAQPVTLDLINEYPASAMSAEADAFFAAAVERRANGRVAIHPIPDAKSGLRSREQLKAVSENRYAIANTLGGSLGEESPVFLLSSLPFLTTTMTD